MPAEQVLERSGLPRNLARRAVRTAIAIQGQGTGIPSDPLKNRGFGAPQLFPCDNMGQAAKSGCRRPAVFSGRAANIFCRFSCAGPVRRAAAEKLPVGRALLPVLCVFDGQECPSYW